MSLLTQTHPLRWVGLGALAALAIYLSWVVIAPFAQVLMLSIVLAVVFSPIHDRISRRVKYPSLAALLSCMVVVLILVLPLVLTAVTVIPELYSIGDRIHSWLQAFLSDPHKQERLTRLTSVLTTRYHIDMQQVILQLQGFVGEFSQIVIERTLSFVKGTIGFIVGIGFVLFTLFFLFRDGALFSGHLVNVLPMEKNQARLLLSKARDMIFASVHGVLVIATIQGILGGLMFAILGLPSALLWGVLMILTSTIPALGAFIIWIPAALYLAFVGSWFKAVVLIIWGTVVIGSIDNFLRPRLVSGRTKTHEVVIFFSVLGGLQVFGLLGFLLGPTILSVTWALIDVIRQDSNSSKNLPPA